jgi:hypothetical protein
MNGYAASLVRLADKATEPTEKAPVRSMVLLLVKRSSKADDCGKNMMHSFVCWFVG